MRSTLGETIKRTLHQLDAALPVVIETRYEKMVTVLFPSQMASGVAGCDGPHRRDVVDYGHLRNGCLFGQQTLAGIGGSPQVRPRRAAYAGVTGSIGTGYSNCWLAAQPRDCSSESWPAGCWLSFVYPATPRDPMVLASVVVAMSLLGLLATWIPVRRALSVDPMILLRDE